MKEIEKVEKELKETVNILVSNLPEFQFFARISGKNCFNSNYGPFYVNSTEDMATYYQEYKNPTTFLSIGASGEQVVNAIYTGAKVIDVYDSNYLSKHAVNLKVAAVRALTLEEIFEFYKTFDIKLFEKIVKYLPNNSSIYWSKLYDLLQPNEVPLVLSNCLFSYKRLDISLVKLINPYLQPENYIKTKNLIDEASINFIESDLYNLPENIKGKKYDGMTFSNIYEYINFGLNTSLEGAQRYRDFIINKMYPHLNEGGVMMVSYLYAWSLKLKAEFDEMHKKNPHKIVGTGALNLLEFEEYLKGHTTQNLSYSYLLDAFANDPIEIIKTNHIVYGQSTDMSNDMALILKK